MKARVMVNRSNPIRVEGESLASIKKEHQALNPGQYVQVHGFGTLANGVEFIIPNYISNSAFQKYLKDPNEFALSYTLFQCPPGFTQTKQMMYGSAFDAVVKNYLVSRLYDHMPAEYEYEAIVKGQCHASFWDKKHPDYSPSLDAFEIGQKLFDDYKTSGALADLMKMLRTASELPRFEFDVTDQIKVEGLGTATILGKPDVYFKTAKGAHIILDWKCNSIFSKGNTSPKKGYIKCSDGWEGNNSKKNHQPHKDASLFKELGIWCNFAHKFEEVDASWAAQTTMYSWLMGTPIGGTVVSGVHQLIGQNKDKPDNERFRIKVAQHVYSITPEYQHNLAKQLVTMWNNVQTGYIFTNLSREENDEKILQLAAVHGECKPGSKEEWLSRSTRKPTYFG